MDEEQATPQEQPQAEPFTQQFQGKWYTRTQASHVYGLAPLTRVTPLSKYLAMALFVVLPFVGFWLGVEYALQHVASVRQTMPPTGGSVSEKVLVSNPDLAGSKGSEHGTVVGTPAGQIPILQFNAGEQAMFTRREVPSNATIEEQEKLVGIYHEVTAYSTNAALPYMRLAECDELCGTRKIPITPDEQFGDGVVILAEDVTLVEGEYRSVSLQFGTSSIVMVPDAQLCQRAMEDNIDRFTELDFSALAQGADTYSAGEGVMLLVTSTDIRDALSMQPQLFVDYRGLRAHYSYTTKAYTPRSKETYTAYFACNVDTYSSEILNIVVSVVGFSPYEL